ncbi:Herc4 [Symbiodinium necroappetens]|uniref:Herc4 protein n=1 Tax=Symbiodinium necroappetens TaxID=1628268 RepID=A0A812X6U7_9DINO|nr:Herc4 [Symbiodinium necroappetens]
MVYQMRSLNPVGMMACVFGVVLVGQAIRTALTALTFLPFSMMTEESRNEASEEMTGLSPNGPDSRKEERLPKNDEATKRERLVWNMIIYFYEHNVSFFASEFGMITILEITYGWSVGACALAMSAKQVARFLIIQILGKIHETRQLTEAALFLATACAAMWGSLFLFRWHWSGSSGAISLLVADSMIYCATCAGTYPSRTWSKDTYKGRPDLQWLRAEHRWQTGHAPAVCSLLVSILIRFLVDKGGRNSFAIFQLVVCFLAFCTACKAVYLKEEVDEETKTTVPPDEAMPKLQQPNLGIGRLSSASAVAAGHASTCAISEAGQLVCFGETEDALPRDQGPMVAVAAGDHYMCVVNASGELVCFGDNRYGQCDVPLDLGPVVAVAAGFGHTCAVKASGELVCFGHNRYGQCDVPLDLGPVVAVAAGLRHTCAVKASGELVCFGGNDFGKSDVPADLGPVVAVAAGRHHTCAVKASGELVCFGRNRFGQCDVPADLGPVVAVAAGRHHTCAVKASGELVCFGDNHSDQCDVPADLGPVVAVAAGLRHTCAVKASGELVCFGDNLMAQCNMPAGFKVCLAPQSIGTPTPDPAQEVRPCRSFSSPTWASQTPEALKTLNPDARQGQSAKSLTPKPIPFLKN